MKSSFYYLLAAIIFILIGWFANSAYHLPKSKENPISQVLPKPLEKYSIENLSNTPVKPSEIKIESTLKEDENFTSYSFSFNFDPTLSGKEQKKVTGLINIPKGMGPFPVVVMFRGYVDQKEYKTGDGTKRGGEYFAKNGMITVAPDFLGYGGSDKEAESIFESRFQTYTTSLVLLKSLDSIERWDRQNVFIWGHSNGGQIALTVLEITKGDYPTVLWAPVSKPFPYSVLYYTDESDDRGKLIRKELSKFEDLYDVELYSLTNYLGNIKVSIELHQGTFDDAVPVAWSNVLIKNLEEKGVDVKYVKHPSSDHNIQPAWNTAIQQSLTFFIKHTHNSQ